MFKKDRDLAERSKTLLKNKEVRTLKADIVKQFPNVNEDELNVVIPNKADITLTKLASKTLLYSIDGVTLFFDVGARNNLYPALPFLWRFPHALPTFVIHGPVSEFVLRGADLMLPGLCASKIAELENSGLREGSKACVRIAGNPLPFAVGDSAVAWATISSAQRRKGRALVVHHVYGDLLAGGKMVPNSGFGPSRIYPIEDESAQKEAAADDVYESASEESDTESAEAEGTGVVEDDTKGGHEEEQNGGVGAEENEEGSAVIDDTEADENAAGAVDDELGEDDAEGVTLDHDIDGEDTGAGDRDEDVNTAPDKSRETSRESQRLQDEALLQAVLLASKYIVKDKQLPMLVSTYWTILQKCAAAAGLPRLDIKASSYRKATTFLSHCQALDLLGLKEDNGVSTITKLNKTHDLFRGVKTDQPEEFKSAVLSTSTSTSGANGNTDGEKGTSEFAQYSVQGGVNGSGGGAGSKKVQVMELFKLTKHLKDIFGVPRGEYGEYLKPGEVRDILVMYIKSHNLENAEDKGCLLVPPADPLHRILAPYSSLSAATNLTTAKKDVHTAKAKAPQTHVSNDTEALEEDFPALASECINDMDASEEYPALNDAFQRSNFMLHPTAGTMAAAPEIKMKIHSGGLRSVDDPHPVSSTGAAAGVIDEDTPLYGVGGWKADKGTAWKPVTLSTTRATATVNASSSATSCKKPSYNQAGKASDAEFPTLGVAASGAKGSAKPAKALNSVGKASSGGGGAVYSELPSDLHLRKEEVFKGVMKKMSPYFGIIAQNGALTVHSGQVPKAKIIVETRMGNKAVTILRGLEVFGLDLSALAKDCQKKFACSVALSSVPGIPKDKEIVIQGNLAYEAELYLAEHKGVPKNLIEVDCSKGAKLKKRK